MDRSSGSIVHTSEPKQKANVIKYQNPPCKITWALQNPDTKSSSESRDNKHAADKGGARRNDPKHPHNSYVPDTNFTLACLVCLCFNLPLGAIAMYLSLSAAVAYRDGDPKLGEKRAKSSVLLSLFSIVSTVLIVMSIVLWVVVENQTKQDLHKRRT